MKIRFFAVAVAVLAAVFAAFRLFGRDAKTELFETYLEESAQGLSEGSEVRFRGVPVGKVESLSFAWSRYRVPKTDEGRRQGRYARIVFSVGKEFLPRDGEVVDRVVEKGLRAFVRDRGFSGLRYIDLDDVDPATAGDVVPFSWKPEHKYIPAAPCRGKTFQDLLSKAGEELSGADFGASYVRLESLVTNASEAAAAVRRAFEDEAPVFEQTMTSLRNATTALDAFMERLRDDPGLVLRKPDDE